MKDRHTEAQGPYADDPGYDWDYEEEQRGPRILWGRVALLGLFLLAAFLLGRYTAPEPDAPDTSRRLRGELSDARAQIADLEQQLIDAQAAQQTEESAATTSPSPTPTEATEQSYVVERGDTIRGIAQRFYGNVALDDCIMLANGIDDPRELEVGATLVIPPEDECS